MRRDLRSPHAILSVILLDMAQTALNRPLVYLAGPDVFYPDPQAVAVRKKNILSEMGMAGLFPLDNQILHSFHPRFIACWQT